MCCCLYSLIFKAFTNRNTAKNCILLKADIQRSLSIQTILWFLCLSILLYWYNNKIYHHQAVGSLNNLRIRRTQEAQDWANPDFRLQDIPKAQAPFHTIDVWYCELLNSTYSSVNSTWFQTQFTFYKTVWCKLVRIWADLLERKTEICSLSKKLCKSSYMLSAFCLWLVELSSLDCNIPNIFVL